MIRLDGESGPLVDVIQRLHPGYTLRTSVEQPQILSDVEPCERCGMSIVALQNKHESGWYELGLRWSNGELVWLHCWPHTPDNCTRERTRRTAS